MRSRGCLRKAKTQSGSILALTLVIMVVAVSLYLTTSSALFVHLNWGARWKNREIAEQYAKMAINTALSEIRHDLSYKEDITIKFDEEIDDCKAHLTFDPDKGVPWSTNNAQGETTVEGWKGPDELSAGQVYPRMVKLVGVGEFRGSRSVMEALIAFPQFPYALASSGPVVAEGKLEVLGVDSLADTADGVTEEEERAGHIVSNSNDARAVVLNPEVKVTGDVQAVGQVVANGAEVQGKVTSSTTPFPILDMGMDRPPNSDPKGGLYINDYDPDKFSENKLREDFAAVNNSSDPYKASEIRVKIDTQGQTLYINKGLELSDALVWIDGDVVIRGGIRGTGAVMATGKITVIGPSSLDSDTTALISGGGINLDGQGLGRSRFRGLVATLGDFVADSAEIQGAYIAAGVDPVTNIGTSKMELRDVKVVQAPDATKVSLDVHQQLKITLTGGQEAEDSTSGNQIGLKVGDDFYTFTGDTKLDPSDPVRKAQLQATYQALKATPEQIASGTYPMAEGQVVVVDAGGNIVPESSHGLVLRRATKNLNDDWKSYSGSIIDTSKEVDVNPILDIDLSKFTSGTSRTTILYYIEN